MIRLLRLAILFSLLVVFACERLEPPSAGAAPTASAGGPPALFDVPRTPRPRGGRTPVLWIGMDGLD
ncbi:MAG TPA: hypothetical protein VOA00_06920, partial [Thermoanaerobaculia bacterium]|nr:hypothetical protein [Thermoanaerobaculia bacterium]